MISRYEVARPLTRARLKYFVALDNITAQPVLIEIVHGKKPHARIWTAYNLDRELGTYTAVYPNGRVSTITIYPGGRLEERLNRPADKKR
jgi:hypothetical protein